MSDKNMPARRQRGVAPVGLYIHVPFCDGKCRYCAFYSVKYQPGTAERYISAISRELEILMNEFPAFTAETVYIGGGTPTLLATEQLAGLCRIVGRAVSASGVAEWTVEANPAPLDSRKLALLKAAGVNRISLGAQSFDDCVLKLLGRRHTVCDIREAVGKIREAGFERLGLDLIACVPGVGLKAWRKTIEDALRLEPDHVSVYSLTVEEETALAGMVSTGAFRVRSEKQQLDALRLAEHLLTGAGFSRYEISNYALPGCECLHNLACWRGEGYLGLGPAAASYAGSCRWTNAADLHAYLAALGRGEYPLREKDELSAATRAVEMLVFGLRTSEGVSPAAIARRCVIPRPLKKKWLECLEELSKSGLVEFEHSKWILTARGRELADYVAVELME